MENHKYSLTKKGKSICPACGKKTFVNYIDAGGNILNQQVGKCDRADNCGHHYSPKQYFTDNNISFDKQEKYIAPIKPLIVPEPSYIDNSIFHKSLQRYDTNIFVQYLIRIFGQSEALAACVMYNIGTAKDGKTVFWQIDIEGKIRSGKIILYDQNGNRRKNTMPPVQWVHSALQLPDYNLKQCLFGEHRLKNTNKPVCIVESEKSAVIASLAMPRYICPVQRHRTQTLRCSSGYKGHRRSARHTS